MPMMWDEITNAAAPKPWPHASMAIGVEVMRKFITPYPRAAESTATMNFGCAAISRSGRPEAACSAALGAGMRMKRSSTMVAIANTMSTRYAPSNFLSARSTVHRLSVGPMMPPTKPPASTSEMAVGLYSGVATSAAAKR